MWTRNRSVCGNVTQLFFPISQNETFLHWVIYSIYIHVYCEVTLWSFHVKHVVLLQYLWLTVFLCRTLSTCSRLWPTPCWWTQPWAASKTANPSTPLPNWRTLTASRWKVWERGFFFVVVCVEIQNSSVYQRLTGSGAQSLIGSPESCSLCEGR